MMPQVQNKAIKPSKGRCGYCGRPVGTDVQQCRPARSGWWCWQQGLIHDPSLFRPPAPDPISEHEQDVIDAYAPRVAEAQKLVDEAMVILAAVEGTYRRAWEDALAVGITTAAGRCMIVPNLKVRQTNEQEVRDLTRAVEDATRAKTRADNRLQAARRRLIRLETERDMDRRAARQPATVEEF